jgi:23S rRNA (adenine2503-C2)-methyltransferase
MNEIPLIYDLDYNSIEAILTNWGEPAYRGRQVWQGLYQNFWQDPMDFTNLPIELRQQLSTKFRFSSLNPQAFLQSTDGETQ